MTPDPFLVPLNRMLVMAMEWVGKRGEKAKCVQEKRHQDSETYSESTTAVCKTHRLALHWIVPGVPWPLLLSLPLTRFLYQSLSHISQHLPHILGSANFVKTYVVPFFTLSKDIHRTKQLAPIDMGLESEKQTAL